MSVQMIASTVSGMYKSGAEAESNAATEALEVVHSLPCETDAQEAEIVSFIQEAKKKAAELEEKRQSAVKPLNEAVKIINSWFKPAVTTYLEIERILKSKVLARRTKLEKERREALATVTKAETSEDAVFAIQVAEQSKPAENKAVGVSKVWTWKMVDVSLVPREFLEVNGPAVTAAVRAGVREIPGIEIYQEERIAVKR